MQKLIRVLVLVPILLLLSVHFSAVTLLQHVLPLPNEMRGLIQVAELTSPLIEAGDFFGSAVDISADGSTAIIGAPEDTDDDGVFEAGSAYIFVRNGGTWEFETKLIASDSEEQAWFGRKVVMSTNGNTAVVTAPNKASTDGAAYVFTRTETGWIEQPLMTTSGLSSRGFGSAAAISADGNMIMVGASSADYIGIETGIVFVFERDGSNWIELDPLVTSDHFDYSFFGNSIALSDDGTTALIGAYGDDAEPYFDVGSAYIFLWDGFTWTEYQKLPSPEPTDESAFFGWSVSLSDDGSTALIGAPYQNFPVSQSGSAYVFLHDTGGTNEWVLQAQVYREQAGEAEYFGDTLALTADGNTAFIGVPSADELDVDTGTVLTFNRSGESWIPDEVLIDANGLADDRFGSDVAITPDGVTALVGVFGRNVNAGTAYVFVQQFEGCDFVTTIPVSECDALVALYNSTSGTAWTNRTGWLQMADPCGWFGVTCEAGSILRLNLPANQLVGTLPSELGNLTNLQTLSLVNNQLSGSIPATFGNLNSLLDLSLDINSLTGSIPPQLATIANLEILSLSDNQLNGIIPSEFGNRTSLIALYLQDNQLVGNIPPQLGNLTNLESLWLSNNQLNGSIPSQLGNITNLEYLFLDNNQLSGEIPPQLGNLDNLLDLFLGGNELTGTLPIELGNLSKLQTLSLIDNRLSGSIPNALGNLDTLTELFLFGNALSDDIPASLTNLTTLNYLDLSYNALTASDPALLVWLAANQPEWDQTQTVAPSNFTAVGSTEGLTINWTVIPYADNGGYYTVNCTGAIPNSVPLELEINTFDKTIATTTFAGVPTGLYDCSISTFTPAKEFINQNDLTSSTRTVDNISVTGEDLPPNDEVVNAFPLTFFGQQHKVYNFENATVGAQETVPPKSATCDLEVPQDAGGIHYEVTINSNQSPGLVVRAGGPAWFRPRNVLENGDTAVAVFDSAGNVKACADDAINGEIGVSSAVFDFVPGETYRVVVWSESVAPEGIDVMIEPATFDLIAPEDNLLFEPPSVPTTFTWQPHPTSVGDVTYLYEIVRVSDDVLDTYRLRLTSSSADTDNFACAAGVCTLNNVQSGTALFNYIDNNDQGGVYLWSVSLITPDNTLEKSNNVFGFNVGEPLAENRLTNGGFETDVNSDKVPDGWTAKNLTKDKIKCNKDDKIYAQEGECAFQFKGSVGEKATLIYLFPIDAVATGETLVLSAQVRGAIVGTGGKMILTIKYSDAADQEYKPDIAVNDPDTYRQVIFTQPLAITGTVELIKIKIKNKSTSGKWLIDDIRLDASAGSRLALPEAQELLPLPGHLPGSPNGRQ